MGCAHPLITHLLDVPAREVERLERDLREGVRGPLPGAVRASIGLATTAEDVDRLAGALTEIATAGPRLRYEHLPERDEYRPVGARSPAARAA